MKTVTGANSLVHQYQYVVPAFDKRCCIYEACHVLNLKDRRMPVAINSNGTNTCVSDISNEKKNETTCYFY